MPAHLCPSYDTRGAHADTPSHWRDEDVLEDRAVFRTLRQPAELIITPVLEKDVGNFRCRVDFKMTPTRNSNVNLEVVGMCLCVLLLLLSAAS